MQNATKMNINQFVSFCVDKKIKPLLFTPFEEVLTTIPFGFVDKNWKTFDYDIKDNIQLKDMFIIVISDLN